MILELTRREVMRAMLTSGPAMKLRDMLQQSSSGGITPVLRQVNIPIAGLDRRLDGLRVGQLTDVHVGATLGLDHLQRALGVFGKTTPDILCVTGDLLDDPRLTRPAMDLLAGRKAPYGAYYSLGNHENFVDRNAIISAARAHDTVKLLVNESFTVEVQGAKVNLSGVDYPEDQEATVQRQAINAACVASAIQCAPDGDLRLCLAHHPDDFDEIARRGVELPMSGHTHGGQIAPVIASILARPFKYFYGSYKQDQSHLYVSGGTGHNFPLRLGVPMEVTEFTLRRV